VTGEARTFGALETNSYTSLHSQHAPTPAARPHTSVRPPRPYTWGTPPELPSSIPLRVHVYTPAAHLQSAIPLCLLHVPTPAAGLRSSRSLEANTSSSPGPQHASRSPYLHTTSSLHLRCAARALEANTSTSTHLQGASRAPELHASIPPCLHACSPSPYLHTSSSLHLQCASRAPERHASIRRRPYTCSELSSPSTASSIQSSTQRIT